MLRGALLEVLESSPARREPACEYAARCGGCDWLHADEATQLQAKREIVLSALEHLGGIPRAMLEVGPMVPSSAAMGYRRRAVLHFAREGLGYFARKSHERVAIERCPALTSPLARLPPLLAAALFAISKDVEAVNVLAQGDQVSVSVMLKGPERSRHRAVCEAAIRSLGLEGVVLVPRDGAPQLLGRPVLRAENPLVPEVPLYLRPDAFAQANEGANARLVASAALALGALAADAVLELFSGNGNFTFAIASTAATVLGVETSGVAIELARRSAREGGVGNVRFVQGDAARVCPGLVSEQRRFDRLLVDPPRSGIPGLGPWARRLGVHKVVYVACDPGSLARDASELVSSGFIPQGLEVIDMFPQTRHVEAVMSFTRTCQ